MVASRKWSAAIAELLVAELGATAAYTLVAKMRQVPGANKSAEQTLEDVQLCIADRL